MMAIEGLTATVTYTDVHKSRERFLRRLMDPWSVNWQSACLPSTAGYEMAVGTYTAPDTATLAAYLTHLGSRLVFLIDWNKARKTIARFVSRSDAVAILKWAADTEVGHRAFLEVGQDALQAVLERGPRAQLTYGRRLDEILGSDASIAFFQAVLRISWEGVGAKRSRRLIADEIEAELLSHLETMSCATLTVAADHAALVVALGDRVSQVLSRAGSSRGRLEAERGAVLAKAWETKADAIVQRARSMPDGPSDATLSGLLTQADAAADFLEQAAYLLTIAPIAAGLEAAATLTPLADAVCRATRVYARCLECARDLPRGARSDIDDVLVAVDRLLQIEHEADAAERAAEAHMVETCGDFRQLHVLSRVAQVLESAVDALRQCGFTLRELALREAAVSS
ncbi:MAG: hypothetical protein QM736_08970 [Vicinamibacterales bacterium]